MNEDKENPIEKLLKEKITIPIIGSIYVIPIIVLIFFLIATIVTLILGIYFQVKGKEHEKPSNSVIIIDKGKKYKNYSHILFIICGVLFGLFIISLFINVIVDRKAIEHAIML